MEIESDPAKDASNLAKHGASAPSHPTGQHRLVRYPVNERGRDYAVGDIHGAFSALRAGLDQIGFDPACDRLFSVGDLVDRGPESLAVLEWLDQPWFHAIMGNHEMLAWRAAMDDPFPGVDHAWHGGSWLASLDQSDQLAIADRLRSLPVVMEVETTEGLVGLIHADCPYDDWDELRGENWDALDDLDPSMKVSLWSSMRYAQQYTTPVRNVRAVVHGHTTIPAMAVLGNVYFIDTGGWCAPAPGRFTFLDLESLAPRYGSGSPYRPPSRRSL